MTSKRAATAVLENGARRRVWVAFVRPNDADRTSVTLAPMAAVSPKRQNFIYINRNGLRWRDALSVYGRRKTLYNRWKRWSEKGVFVWMMVVWLPSTAKRKP